MVVNNFSEGRTEKAHEGFSNRPAPLYNKRKAKPSRSVPFLLIVAGKNAAGRLYFCHYHPRSEKKRKEAGLLLDGVRDIPDSAALACGGDVRVRVGRTQKPPRIRQKLRPGCAISAGKRHGSGPGSAVLDRRFIDSAGGPPPPDPKGVPPLYWLWATCTRNAENLREGVKTALKPHSPAGPLWA